MYIEFVALLCGVSLFLILIGAIGERKPVFLIVGASFLVVTGMLIGIDGIETSTGYTLNETIDRNVTSDNSFNESSNQTVTRVYTSSDSDLNILVAAGLILFGLYLFLNSIFEITGIEISKW